MKFILFTLMLSLLFFTSQSYAGITLDKSYDQIRMTDNNCLEDNSGEVNIVECNSERANQWWKRISASYASGHWFGYRNYYTGKCLSINGLGNEASTRNCLQDWRNLFSGIHSSGFNDLATYYGHCLKISEDDSLVQSSDCENAYHYYLSNSVRHTLKTNEWAQIKASHSNLCVTNVHNNGGNPSDHLYLRECDDNDLRQFWKKTPLRSGNYIYKTFTAKNSCLGAGGIYQRAYVSWECDDSYPAYGSWYTELNDDFHLDLNSPWDLCLAKATDGRLEIRKHSDYSNGSDYCSGFKLIYSLH